MANPAGTIRAGHPAYRPPKATDDQLLSSYATTKSVWDTAREFGMCGQSVHERLVKLGANQSQNLFTEVEQDRLRSEYWIAAETGKLAELAADMGRTKHFICRQAKALGLTSQSRQRQYLSVWKYVGEESARIFFDQFKRSSLGLGKYCLKKAYDDLGFANCMKRHFADEWEHVIELKQPKQSKYRYGRAFEYRVRDDLKRLGYFALRSPASKSPIDILGVRPGEVLFVQCKRGGALPPGEWNALFDLCQSCGAIPVLATCPLLRGITYQRLVARKSGDRGQRQPLAPFTPGLHIEVGPI